jgi:hypothetical protein
LHRTDGVTLRKREFARAGIDPFVNAERADLSEREIGDMIVAIITMPVRENFADVGDVVEDKVVNHQRLVVLGEHDVLFDEVGPQAVGQRHAGQGVFGEIAARAAVGDHQRGGFRLRGSGNRRKGDSNEQDHDEGCECGDVMHIHL